MQLPRFHRLRSAYYKLEGRRCAACGAVQFPPRPVCSGCGGRDLAPHRLSGRGRVFSFSQTVEAPPGFGSPHLLALVELEEGIRVAAQLTDIDPDDVEIGLPVEMVTRRVRETGERGYLVYGYKFRPLLRTA